MILSTLSASLTSWLRGRLRKTNPYRVDTCIAAGVLVVATVPYVHAGATPPTWQAYALTVCTALPLIWRRRAPLAVALVVAAATAATVVVYGRSGQPMQYGALVALYTVFAMAPRSHRLFALVGWGVGVPVIELCFHPTTPTMHAYTALTYFSAGVLGTLTRIRHAHSAALEERNHWLERERERESARAAARERARIARDMHDILAHAVSLMVVQAEAGPVVVRTNPARAEAAFTAIATAGRDAMDQLQHMLGLLKKTGSREPQPSVGRIGELVRDVRRTRLRVRLRHRGKPRPLRADVEVAAYRVVQEALTNTVKHAKAGIALVCLDWTDDALVVTVSDDGRGPGERPGVGHGLIGLSERAAACGGSATTGAGPDGRGFVVEARLPARAAEREVHR